MKRQLMHAFVFLFLFAVSYQFLDNPYSDTYLETLTNDVLETSITSDSLYLEIKEKAHLYEEKPVDAMIDPIWKAIPGYNGVKVDVRKSYENMKKEKAFDERKLIYIEQTPNVSLKDLKPAPIYKGNPKKRMVAFQVNVAWGNEYLIDLLKTLKKHQIHVTFNLDGSWTKKHPRLAKMIAEAGHEIGNHGYSHPDFQKLSNEEIRKQLQMTNDIIEATVKQTPKWFAPPSGSYNERTVQIAHELNLGTILWTIDTVDWKNPNPYEMANRVIQESHPGAMILMHPTKATSEALDTMIEGIERKGLKISTVSDLLDEKRHD